MSTSPVASVSAYHPNGVENLQGKEVPPVKSEGFWGRYKVKILEGLAVAAVVAGCSPCHSGLHGNRGKEAPSFGNISYKPPGQKGPEAYDAGYRAPHRQTTKRADLRKDLGLLSSSRYYLPMKVTIRGVKAASSLQNPSSSQIRRPKEPGKIPAFLFPPNDDPVLEEQVSLYALILNKIGG